MMEIELFEHQKEFLEKGKEIAKKFFGNGNLLLADEQGLGKTIQSILYLKEIGLIEKVIKESKNVGLIIAPNNVVVKWKEEFLKVLGEEKEIKGNEIVVLEPKIFRTPSLRKVLVKDILQNKVKILIINYENLQKLVDIFNTELKDVIPKWIIIDESHKIKNKDTKTFKILKEFIEKYIKGESLDVITKKQIGKLENDTIKLVQNLITNCKNKEKDNPFLPKIEKLLYEVLNHIKVVSVNDKPFWDINKIENGIFDLKIWVKFIDYVIKAKLWDKKYGNNTLKDWNILEYIDYGFKFINNYIIPKIFIKDILKTKIENEILGNENLKLLQKTKDLIKSYILEKEIECFNGIENILLLSGTPLSNNVVELYTQLYLIDYLKWFANNYSHFLNRYLIVKLIETRDGRRFQKIIGSKEEQIKELNTILQKTCLIRRTKEEVLKEHLKEKFVYYLPLHSYIHNLPIYLYLLHLPYNIYFLKEIYPYLDKEKYEKYIKKHNKDYPFEQYLWETINVDIIQVPKLYNELEKYKTDHKFYNLITFIPKTDKNEDEENLTVLELFENISKSIFIGNTNLLEEFEVLLKDDVINNKELYNQIKQKLEILSQWRMINFQILFSYYFSYFLFKIYRAELKNMLELYNNKKLKYTELKSNAIRLLNRIRQISNIGKIPITLLLTLGILNNGISDLLNVLSEQYKKNLKEIQNYNKYWVEKIYTLYRDIFTNDYYSFKYEFGNFDVYLRNYIVSQFQKIEERIIHKIITQFGIKDSNNIENIKSKNYNVIIPAILKNIIKFYFVNYFNIDIEKIAKENNINEYNRFINLLVLFVLNTLNFSRATFINKLLENNEISKAEYYKQKFKENPSIINKVENDIIISFIQPLTLGNNIKDLYKIYPNFAKGLDLNLELGKEKDNKKVIIFTIFRVVQNIFYQLFSTILPQYIEILQNNYELFTLFGGMKKTEISNVVKEFNNTKNKAILLASLYVANMGIDLVGANYIIFNDLDLTIDKHLQAEDRIYRIGQTKNAYIIYPIQLNNSIDIHIFNLITAKRDIFNSTFSNKKLSSPKNTISKLISLL